MKLEEVKEFLMVMNAYYPNWKPEVPVQYIAKAWHADLLDYSVDDVNMAFSIYRSQGNQFPPAQPGILINLLSEATDDSLSESEAWGLVVKAKSNGIYGSQMEFDALPEDVQKAVGSPQQLYEWAISNDSSTVKESNFKRAYRTVIQRKKAQRVLPESVRIALNERKLLEGSIQ